MSANDLSTSIELEDQLLEQSIENNEHNNQQNGLQDAPPLVLLQISDVPMSPINLNNLDELTIPNTPKNEIQQYDLMEKNRQKSENNQNDASNDEKSDVTSVEQVIIDSTPNDIKKDETETDKNEIEKLTKIQEKRLKEVITPELISKGLKSTLLIIIFGLLLIIIYQHKQFENYEQNYDNFSLKNVDFYENLFSDPILTIKSIPGLLSDSLLPFLQTLIALPPFNRIDSLRNAFQTHLKNDRKNSQKNDQHDNQANNTHRSTHTFHQVSIFSPPHTRHVVSLSDLNELAYTINDYYSINYGPGDIPPFPKPQFISIFGQIFEISKSAKIFPHKFVNFQFDNRIDVTRFFALNGVTPYEFLGDEVVEGDYKSWVMDGDEVGCYDCNNDQNNDQNNNNDNENRNDNNKDIKLDHDSNFDDYAAQFMKGRHNNGNNHTKNGKNNENSIPPSTYLTVEDLPPESLKLAKQWLLHFRLSYKFIGILIGPFFEKKIEKNGKKNAKMTPFLNRINFLSKQIEFSQNVSFYTKPPRNILLSSHPPTTSLALPSSIASLSTFSPNNSQTLFDKSSQSFSSNLKNFQHRLNPLYPSLTTLPTPSTSFPQSISNFSDFSHHAQLLPQLPLPSSSQFTPLPLLQPLMSIRNYPKCIASHMENSGDVFWCKQTHHYDTLAIYDQLVAEIKRSVKYDGNNGGGTGEGGKDEKKNNFEQSIKKSKKFEKEKNDDKNGKNDDKNDEKNKKVENVHSFYEPYIPILYPRRVLSSVLTKEAIIREIIQILEQTHQINFENNFDDTQKNKIGIKMTNLDQFSLTILENVITNTLITKYPYQEECVCLTIGQINQLESRIMLPDGNNGQEDNKNGYFSSHFDLSHTTITSNIDHSMTTSKVGEKVSTSLHSREDKKSEGGKSEGEEKNDEKNNIINSNSIEQNRYKVQSMVSALLVKVLPESSLYRSFIQKSVIDYNNHKKRQKLDDIFEGEKTPKMEKELDQNTKFDQNPTITPHQPPKRSVLSKLSKFSTMNDGNNVDSIIVDDIDDNDNDDHSPAPTTISSLPTTHTFKISSIELIKSVDSPTYVRNKNQNDDSNNQINPHLPPPLLTSTSIDGTVVVSTDPNYAKHISSGIPTAPSYSSLPKSAQNSNNVQIIPYTQQSQLMTGLSSTNGINSSIEYIKNNYFGTQTQPIKQLGTFFSNYEPGQDNYQSISDQIEGLGAGNNGGARGFGTVKTPVQLQFQHYYLYGSEKSQFGALAVVDNGVDGINGVTAKEMNIFEKVWEDARGKNADKNDQNDQNDEKNEKNEQIKIIQEIVPILPTKDNSYVMTIVTPFVVDMTTLSQQDLSLWDIFDDDKNIQKFQNFNSNLKQNFVQKNARNDNFETTIQVKRTIENIPKRTTAYLVSNYMRKNNQNNNQKDNKNSFKALPRYHTLSSTSSQAYPSQLHPITFPTIVLDANIHINNNSSKKFEKHTNEGKNEQNYDKEAITTSDYTTKIWEPYVIDGNLYLQHGLIHFTNEDKNDQNNDAKNNQFDDDVMDYIELIQIEKYPECHQNSMVCSIGI